MHRGGRRRRRRETVSGAGRGGADPSRRLNPGKSVTATAATAVSTAATNAVTSISGVLIKSPIRSGKMLMVVNLMKCNKIREQVMMMMIDGGGGGGSERTIRYFNSFDFLFMWW